MSQTLCRLLAWGLTLVLALAGCQLKPLPGGWPGTGLPQDGISQTIPLILGNVVDALGRPVEGATVRAYVAPYQVAGLSSEPQPSVQATTDSKGAFQLQAPPLGSVTVEARGHDQKAMRMGVAVATGARVELGTLSLQPTGRLAGRVTAPQGTVLLGTDVFIPGTDYLAKTAADGSYLLQDVPAGTCQVAALRPGFQPRVLEGVVVRAGETTRVPDLELSLDAPVLTGLNPQSGGPGTVVILRGSNFGASKQTGFQVTFNDTLAVTARRVSDTEIQATVPTGATSGGVVVRSNGIASAPQTFQVIASLQVYPRNVGLFPAGTTSFGIEARDEHGEVVPGPFVQWTFGEPSLGTLDALGHFRAVGTGVAPVTLSSGWLSIRGWIGVTPYLLSTFAGNGLTGGPLDGAMATGQAFGYPSGVVADAHGNVYVALGEARRIWRIDATGRCSLLAGSGQMGNGGDGGPAPQATLGSHLSLAVDARNRLLVSDYYYHVVRCIPLDAREEASGWQAGFVYRVAGTGVQGYAGSGRSARDSALAAPCQLASAPEGVYVADSLNHRLRLITPDGNMVDVMGTGQPEVRQGPDTPANMPLVNPSACAVDPVGNVLVGDKYRLLFWCRVAGTYFGQPREAGMVYSLVGQAITDPPYVGDTALERAALAPIVDVRVDETGTCWFLESGRPLVRCLTSDGRLVTVAGSAEAAAAKRATVYVGEGDCALRAALGAPVALALTGSDLLVADAAHHRIRRLSLPRS